MERFQLIRKMYLQGTISLGAAIILAETDEERQEIRDLSGLVEYQENCNASRSLQIAHSWNECSKNRNDYYDEMFALDCIYDISRTSDESDYCGVSSFDVIEQSLDNVVKVEYDFDDFEQITQYRRQHHPIMTMREYSAYTRFSTHRREREIAEEWIAGNIVSVPRGLDLTYITSHYHSLLPYHHH